MGRLCVTALCVCLLAVASCTTGPAHAPPENTVLNVFPGPPPPPPYQPVLADSPVERAALPSGQGTEVASPPNPPVSDVSQVAVAPSPAGVQPSTQAQGQTYQSPTYQPQPTYQPTYQPSPPSSVGPCAENGSCYGDISNLTGRPKTVAVRGYYRKDGTYVRGHYRSH
jgi:hypothetical protein